MSSRLMKIGAALALFGWIAASAPVTAAASSGDSAWTKVPTPNVATPDGQLNAVAPLSSGDVWAVGVSRKGALIEHFDGTNWSIVPGVDEGRYATLVGVAAISSNDVWAIGDSSGSPFAERWNGHHWSAVAVQSGGGRTSALNAIAAVSASDIWAVGQTFYEQGNTTDELIEHWNGKTWRIVSDPPHVHFHPLGMTALSQSNIWVVGERRYDTSTVAEHWNGRKWSVTNAGSAGQLNAVSGYSPSGIWAVGAIGPDSADNQIFNGLIERWNGASWSVGAQSIPDAVLTGVAAVSSRDVWVVGRYGTPANHPYLLLEQWNGSRWVTRKQRQTAAAGDFNAVAGSRRGDVWAVGRSLTPSGGSSALAMKWNGSSWASTPMPRLTRTNGALTAVSADSPQDVWAVGSHQAAVGQDGVVDHFTGKSWTQMLLPIPSSVQPSEGVLVWGHQVYEGSHDYTVQLSGVAALSPSNVWVVGYTENRQFTAYTPLIEHWNGVRWNVLPNPASVVSSDLNAIDALAPNDIWAVGSDLSDDQPLIEHWNGVRWQVVTGPNVSGGYLQSMSAVGAKDIWTVGTKLVNCEIDSCAYTLVEHWDGSKWRQVPSPSPMAGGTVAGLSAIFSASHDDGWSGGQTLEHWNGASWSVAPGAGSFPNGYIAALAGSGADSVWALDEIGGDPTVGQGTALEHWNGSSWVSVSYPITGNPNHTMLSSITTISGQTWTVGAQGSVTLAMRTS
jgi:hypothetical protein